MIPLDEFKRIDLQVGEILIADLGKKDPTAAASQPDHEIQREEGCL